MLLALIWRALAAILIIAIIPSAWGQPLQPVPTLVAHAIDHTGTLTTTELQALDQRLARFEQEKGTQIVVLLVPSTAPEDIAAYANRVANTWKIGRQSVGDGMLIVVAKNDRKLRIEVAKTLEGAVPDLAARQIMDDAITPRFKQNDYAGGLNAGIEQLFARVRGEPLPSPTSRSASGDQAADGFDWVDLGIFFFIIVPVGTSIARALLGRVAGSLLMGAATGVIAYLVTASILVALGAALLAMVWGAPSRSSSRGGGLLGGTGWSSGSSSSGGGSSGGFSSGGGGDFGGGGASGDW